MAIKLVREPSAVPNIKNSDDARLFRYAVGKQDGFVKKVGLECSYVIDGSIFRVMPGEIVLHGYDIVIDGNNAYISIDNIATKRYYSVYVELNLMTQKAELKQLFDTAGYPNLPTSDDLTSNTYGTANLELYKFTATNGVISDVSKVIKIIDYNVCPNLPQTDRSDKIANTEYVRQAISDVKNIIIGSSVINPNITVGTNIVKRQVNFVYLNISMPRTSADQYQLTFYKGNDGLLLATLPVGFRPKTKIYAAVQGIGTFNFIFNGETSLMATIDIDGKIIISVSTLGGETISFQSITCGFEII